VLHTWGSALTHHPHVHGIVPAAVVAYSERCLAFARLSSCRWRVLSRLFRRDFLEDWLGRMTVGTLQFFGEYAALADTPLSPIGFAPLRDCELGRLRNSSAHSPWPPAVLASLSRYTHRVAISNRATGRFRLTVCELPLEELPDKAPRANKTMTLMPRSSCAVSFARSGRRLSSHPSLRTLANAGRRTILRGARSPAGRTEAAEPQASRMSPRHSLSRILRVPLLWCGQCSLIEPSHSGNRSCPAFTASRA